jgi:hypothetical protein
MMCIHYIKWFFYVEDVPVEQVEVELKEDWGQWAIIDE